MLNRGLYSFDQECSNRLSLIGLRSKKADRLPVSLRFKVVYFPLFNPYAIFAYDRRAALAFSEFAGKG